MRARPMARRAAFGSSVETFEHDVFSMPRSNDQPAL
jgi:hypothetical protein